MKKSQHIVVRISAELRTEVDLLAARSGMRPSELVRLLLASAVDAARDKESLGRKLTLDLAETMLRGLTR